MARRATRVAGRRLDRRSEGQQFPDAFDTLQPFLIRIRTLDYILRHLLQERLCALFPPYALPFLDRVVDEDVTWSDRELKQCLAALTYADPALVGDSRYKRLDEIAR